ncbi:uncharacterized protein LOC134813701 [Bolinopsis microptera]|uniref:uncharacterized protein LOC134813701 n=1 Tax=Bolinopsis microptera TaxID=2820187 RepID=UPI00307ADA2D
MTMRNLLVLYVVLEVVRCLQCNHCLEVSSIGAAETNERITDFKQVSCQNPESVTCVDGQDECITATVNVTITFSGADSTLMVIPINALTQNCGSSKQDFCKQKQEEFVATVTKSENFPDAKDVKSSVQCDETNTCKTDGCGKLEAAKSRGTKLAASSILAVTLSYFLSLLI